LKVTFQAKHGINTLVKNHYISSPRLSMQKENFFEQLFIEPLSFKPF